MPFTLIGLFIGNSREKPIVMKRLLPIIAIILAITVAGSTDAQSQPPVSLNEKLASRNFVFKARTANPSRGRTINLTSEYTVKVSGDSLVADLPYYGRAYSAPIGGTGGIHFISTDFNFTLKQGKKNRMLLTIDPKDVSDAQELSFTIYDNGEADLIVTSNNRQAITFRGHIAEK